MEQNQHSLRDRLLADVPSPDDLGRYRQQVSSLLEAHQKRLGRERIWVTTFWIFCAASATAWLWFGTESAHLPRGPFLACLFFLWGGVERVKHSIQSARLELLKEVKQIQVQLFALQTHIGQPGSRREPG